MNDVTREEMATYYAVRRLTFDLGITDNSFPRPTISRKKPLHKIGRREYEDCLRAELDLIKLAFKYARFDERANVSEELADLDRWRNEALGLREEVRGYRNTLGLPPEDG